MKMMEEREQENFQMLEVKIKSIIQAKDKRLR
jgi:hypothetical protein